MKRFILPMVILASVSCASDQNQAAAATEENETAAPAATAQPKDPNAPVGTITLMADRQKATEGNEICVPIRVGNFNNILSTQYTVSWDQAVLTYSTVKDFKLPYMTAANNFGDVHTEKGKLTCLWIDNSLKGVTLADGAKIYDICFVPKKGSAGKSSPIQFVEEPTPFESVNTQEQILSIIPVEGVVEIE